MEEILHQMISFIHPKWRRISSINSIFTSERISGAYCANQLIPMRFRLDHVKYVTVHQKEASLTSDLHCSKYPRKSVFQQEIYVYKLQTFHDFPVLQAKWCSAPLQPVLESFNWIPLPLPRIIEFQKKNILKSERIQNGHEGKSHHSFSTKKKRMSKPGSWKSLPSLKLTVKAPAKWMLGIRSFCFLKGGAFAISFREGIHIYIYFYLEPFDDPCFDEKKRLLEGSTTKWPASSLAVFLFKVKLVKRFEFRFDRDAFECLDGFSQGIISLGFIGGVAVGASQAISENMKIACLGLGKILGWQWPPETKITDNYSGFQAYV